MKQRLKGRYGILVAVAAVCVASWIALGIGLGLGVDTAWRLTFAIAAALSSEALMWTTAAVLGIGLIEMLGRARGRAGRSSGDR